MDKAISESESLRIIEEMIQKGKRNLHNGSIFYLIWGWAVLIAALTQYALLEIWPMEGHWMSWPIAMASAAIIAVLVGRREFKKQAHVTFTDTAMKYLWIGFILMLFLVLASSALIGWAASYLLIIGLYGLATFVSGGILQFRPLIIGGLASLLLAFGGIFSPELRAHFPNLLLLLSASIIVSYILPGYLLRAKMHRNAA